MEKKKRTKLILLIIIAVLLIGIVIGAIELCSTKYRAYDSSMQLVSNWKCTAKIYSYEEGGNTKFDSYYYKNGSLIGNCSYYSGPGMSMGPKRSCSSDILRSNDGWAYLCLEKPY